MENENTTPQEPKPERKKKKKISQANLQMILPLAIMAGIFILAFIFIMSSTITGCQRKAREREESIAAAESSLAAQEALDQAAARIIAKAKVLADNYDYTGAVEMLDSFVGDMYNYPEMTTNREAYVQAAETLVEYKPEQVRNLSFQLLIADPQRAFADEEYGDAYNKNFITISEFSAILEQLYSKGCVLVSMDDLVTATEDASGFYIYEAKPILLPEGRIPIMITQTQVNYYTYMTDSDDDGVADKGGAGFASRLVLDGNGELACEYITAEGETVTGDYDLVPILESFIESHPGFTYKGARATLAVTGYDGLFGYRGEELSKAGEIADALTDAGYTIACCTYSNLPYGSSELSKIKADLESWEQNVEPILGKVSTLVYARDSDIASQGSYSGTKFNTLKEFGFQYYLGFSSAGKPYLEIGTDYVRQGRVMVTGNNLKNKASWFADLFDAASVLDSSR